MSDACASAPGREAQLCLGPQSGPVVLIAPALFEEANRLRAFTVAVMRGLALRGIGSILPDLPGTNESLVATQDARLDDWRTAFAAAVPPRPTYGVAIRGGALLDGEADLVGRYHLSPPTGADVVRDLVRTRLAAVREGGAAFDPADIDPPGPPIVLAGNAVARDLLVALKTAEPSPAERVVRLDGDLRPADRVFAGRPLWRAAEPDTDPALAAAIAEDIADWIARCAA
ncbi:hypothetical protein FSB78_07745 [Sphingomonas ginsenosidivorax]|uniref:Uncharacterized protein n=1 Tax=Sphingomonas ginsenosidivorax TaxID=862135 RepID=A0A5C6UDW6_9SPHN|nr:hypothetical protein [Sphingomonas ginsenosidivorax]TXC70844.1 hypothetical protein FSB78_07745 [Sphingomonas ginsenosidivorax]